jgi:hypothetical protein
MKRFRRSALAALALLLVTPAVHALEEIPYAVADSPWPDGFGNHRAVVHVDARANAVVANVPWRRRDRDPEQKAIIVVDAATSQRVTNAVRLSGDRFAGTVAFEPVSGPGDYFVYYLPYPAQQGWGSYNGDYFPFKDTADPMWKARLWPDFGKLPAARVLRFEARTEFDSFYPMEVVATPEEILGLLNRNPAPCLLFPEDRRFPIRMTDDLPLKWIGAGPTNVFRGEAQRNEFYVFQVGIWAARTNLAGLDVEFNGDIAKWLRCFNTGGTNWDGQPFHKTLNVPRDRVQALWLGVDVPRDAKPGQHTATVTIRPTNAPPSRVELALAVLPTELADRGDGDLWRLSRLRWLDSELGSDPPQPQSVAVSTGVERQPQPNQTATNALVIDAGSMATLDGREILANPPQFLIEPEPGSVIHYAVGDTEFDHRDDFVMFGQTYLADEFTVNCSAITGPSDFCRTTLTLRAKKRFAVSNLSVRFSLSAETATYFMGLGRRAGPTPTNFVWRWEGPFNSFWTGNAQAGLHVKLLGSSYEGPMQNLYHPKPPPSWFNDGKGGVSVTRGASNEVLVQAFTGPFDLKAGEERTFDFAPLLTPVKALDTATHFRERYWHAAGAIPDDVNVINVHHATLPNPFINYPFLAVDRLREFCRTNQAQGKKVKIYYTVRELTSRLPELWALRSLGDEVLAGGPGGGYPWLREHLGSDYTPAWYTQIEGGQVDAAVLTSGASRWYNFYVEGLNWLVRNVPIDGLYLDDVAYDRTILKRMRHVMDTARPGCLIDLHSNTGFSRGPAVQYTEFFPYVNRLWFGESFDYNAMSPAQWLVECSGIPFGLMGDMLQDGGNRWRGMVFGMTARAPWTDAADPHPVWRVWDEFGIADARMLGWWDARCPVRTGRDDVLATAYVKPGKTLIALASWAKETTAVRLQIDWPALGLDASKAQLIAPEVKDFQPARRWRPDEPISVEPLRGWLIYVSE